jgi:hypothetical protein
MKMMRLAVIGMAVLAMGLSPAWAARANHMGGFPGFGHLPGLHLMGNGMGQFRVGDLDGDTVPEIVTIYSGTYLVILDSEGNLKNAKTLPALPGVTTQDAGHMPGMPWHPEDPEDPSDPEDPEGPTFPGFFSRGSMGMGTLEIADLDGDTVPEILTTYSGAYLIILDNEGNLKGYKVLPSLTDILGVQ